tara:strand:+ start:527 stop:1015 length:489 start_codon:yes stop_codon:yes gene_type:complete
LFRKNIIVLLFFVFFLQSCGFQPLYNMESLSGFIINEPSDKSKSSVIIYKGLDDALKPISTSDNFIINFSIDEQFEDIDIREDEKVLRKNIVISVKFSIKRENEEEEEEIFIGEFRISSAYNRVAEPYANFVNEQDTRDRILLLIIQDIKRQLALFKKNQVK